ncbi:hypothetical protein QWA68_010727 [Fusarium oxysporum]|nr:hypothetical protein QWA68_010727 [Fusarium oxysporum]
MGNSSSLHRPVSQLWRIYERFGKQPETVPEVNKAAVEPVLKGLEAAVELYLGNPICFVNVVLSGQEMNHVYHASTIAEAVHKMGLTHPWNGRATAPRLALLGNGLENFTQPESLVLAIDNSQYGFHLADINQHEGITKMVRRNYHPYTGNEDASERAFSFRQALEDFVKRPFKYNAGGGKMS